MRATLWTRFSEVTNSMFGLGVRLTEVTKKFVGRSRGALQSVSHTFEPGTITFVTGHSGAGKTTLLRLIMNQFPPTYGQVVVGDVNLATLKGGQLPRFRQQLGVVFQEHHLLSARTVLDNVMLPLRISGRSRALMESRALNALAIMGLDDKGDVFPEQLSTGEQQRVGIARALVNRPRLLLADEPTGNLDPEMSKSVMRLFREFREIGTTVIVASHDLALIEAFGAPFIELREGELVGHMKS
ncbi:MAG: ATP-binding cassette domain-containing protein [Gammaproteobacteria bacterium]|nr:ATP-binding cassette domain-containing protein [Gammaproteobacteria bacterium]MCY4199303.1 ATP-binding cassette domain-containing protein [Gammaproteobacteria bacterium]MCY4322240.1 ATP-binding cassette domain-containing protein [Gammaproteobacteria bacterium]